MIPPIIYTSFSHFLSDLNVDFGHFWSVSISTSSLVNLQRGFVIFDKKGELVSKTMQDCRNRSGNLINRKISLFYMESMLNFVFQLQKIFFQKKSLKKSKIRKKSKFQWKSIDFHWFFFRFLEKNKDFFSKKIFFGVEKS